MTIRSFIGVTLLLLGSALAIAEVTIPLQVESGSLTVERDSRVFTVPLSINGVETRFTWGCGGWTTVSEKVARDSRLEIVADDETTDHRDPDGKPMFAGKAKAQIVFGDKAIPVIVKVQRDTAYTRGFVGVIGCEVAAAFQWELNPHAEKPTLTLRTPGTRVEGKMLARMKMKEDQLNYWITVKARNQPVDVLLLPQSSDIQAAPDLQKAWDIATGKEEAEKGVMGMQRTRKLGGRRDAVELTPEIQEMDIWVILIGDKDKPELTPDARSGLGASLLNRFVYRADPKLGEFVIVERVPPPVGKKAAKP